MIDCNVGTNPVEAELLKLEDDLHAKGHDVVAVYRKMLVSYTEALLKSQYELLSLKAVEQLALLDKRKTQ